MSFFVPSKREVHDSTPRAPQPVTQEPKGNMEIEALSSVAVRRSRPRRGRTRGESAARASGTARTRMGE